MDKLIGLNEFLNLKKKFKHKTIVFTNGCFDILHPGHVDYLSKAKQLGDILVIGLNSDSSIRRIKGSKRPINSEKDRARVLSALSCVDFIIIFQEDTPYKLISKIQPDILVKGGDWPVEKIVGRDVVLKKGGKVLNIKLLEGYSTTKIIENILSKYAANK
ncbi:D-glycero-beta-D-manno-heptose 1-phosphate adenylyltransferase [Desulfonauticus submarinus]